MTKEEHFTYLNSIFCCELLANYLDELKHTSAFKSNLKVSANQLNNQLNIILNKELKKLFSIDEEIVINTMAHYKELIETISTFKLDDLSLINSILKSYSENKEHFLETNEVVIKQLK